jgi:hypothetical protein
MPLQRRWPEWGGRPARLRIGAGAHFGRLVVLPRRGLSDAVRKRAMEDPRGAGGPPHKDSHQPMQV